MKPEGYIWAGLYVQDLERAIVFYRDTLGMRLVGSGADYAHLLAGKGALFELYSGGVASPVPKEPEEQSLILGIRVEDLDEAMNELKSKGVAFTGEIGEYKGSRWAHFHDPEGNRLEIKEAPSG